MQDSTPFLKEYTEDSLAKAEGLITKGWIKGHWAVDKYGKPCPPESEQACAWCEEGAIKAATHYIAMDPETGEETPERLSLREKVRKACTALLQASDERHAVAYIKAHKAHETSRNLDGAISGIPHVNDATDTQHSWVIGAFQRARKLCNLAHWPGTPQGTN